MSFLVKKIDKKSEDWKILSVVNGAGDLVENVSVNRINKKGENFPGFDEIREGEKVDGNLWESPANKLYLFAPKGSKASLASQNSSQSDQFSVSNAEIKNLLTLKVIPMLEAIYKQNPPLKREPAYDVAAADQMSEDLPF